MREVAKEGASVRIVAHVLNDRASIGIGLRTAQIFFGSLWKFLEKQWLDVILPGGIDDGFVRKDRVRADGSRPRQPNAEQANDHQTRANEYVSHDFSRRRKLPLQLHFRELRQDRPSWLQERLGVANRNAEIGAAKSSDNCKGHS